MPLNPFNAPDEKTFRPCFRDVTKEGFINLFRQVYMCPDITYLILVHYKCCIFHQNPSRSVQVVKNGAIHSNQICIRKKKSPVTWMSRCSLNSIVSLIMRRDYWKLG